MVKRDYELRDIIQKDLDRTMQEFEFYTRPEVKESLFNILYLWAKDNTEFGYRQGMNEILGIIVYAVF